VVGNVKAGAVGKREKIKPGFTKKRGFIGNKDLGP